MPTLPDSARGKDSPGFAPFFASHTYGIVSRVSEQELQRFVNTQPALQLKLPFWGSSFLISFEI